MSVNDPIADMLTRIRNAMMSGQAMTAMPFSKVKVEIAKILKEEGYLESIEVADGERPNQKVLRLKIKYIGERRERQPGNRRSGAHQPPWPPCVHQETGNSLGAFRNWHCHPVHAQGHHDRSACPPVECWR